MSQCDQLAALLSDGRWWSCRELLREVPCTVHSRMSELRKRGLEIEHETTGAGAAGSRYRLVSISAEPEAERDQDVARPSESPVSWAPTATGEPASALTNPAGFSSLAPCPAGSLQLSLEDVAA